EGSKKRALSWPWLDNPFLERWDSFIKRRSASSVRGTKALLRQEAIVLDVLWLNELLLLFVRRGQRLPVVWDSRKEPKHETFGLGDFLWSSVDRVGGSRVGQGSDQHRARRGIHRRSRELRGVQHDRGSSRQEPGPRRPGGAS